MQVRVKLGKIGFYGLCRRRAGDVFEINSKQEFSKKWMEEVKPGSDEKKDEKRGDSPKKKSGKSAGDKQVI